MQNNMTALLVMDVQGATVPMLTDRKNYFSSLNHAISQARKNDVPVIYGIVAFRKGFPEVSPNNKFFQSVNSGGKGFDSKEATTIDSAVMPLEGDLVFTKRRISSFAGSDLEVILRSKGITHLVLTGLSTSGVVLSTLREAADKDFQITVLADCCADRDEEVHRVLLTKIFPRQATVMNAAEWEPAK